jgi:hypothetical protein
MASNKSIDPTAWKLPAGWKPPTGDERLRRADANLYPVVRLKPGGFQHKDSRVGWVAVPSFVVVGKASKDTAVKPDTTLAGEMNDEIPF